MQVVKPTDGYASLAEQVIKWCILDVKRKTKNCYEKKNKYIACLFFTNEDCKEFWTGLAPHMIRDFEKYEAIAKELLKTELADYKPIVMHKREKEE